MPSVPHIKLSLTPLVVLSGCVVAGLFVGCSSGSDPDSSDCERQQNKHPAVGESLFECISRFISNGMALADLKCSSKLFLHGFNAHMLSRIGVDPNALDPLFVSEPRWPAVQDPLRSPGELDGVVVAIL